MNRFEKTESELIVKPYPVFYEIVLFGNHRKQISTGNITSRAIEIGVTASRGDIAIRAEAFGRGTAIRPSERSRPQCYTRERRSIEFHDTHERIFSFYRTETTAEYERLAASRSRALKTFCVSHCPGTPGRIIVRPPAFYS